MPDYRAAVFEVRVPMPEGVMLEQMREYISKIVRPGLNGPPLYLDKSKIRVKSGSIYTVLDKPPSTGIHIAKHAIDRFRERTGCTQSDNYIAEKLRDFFNRSFEVELTKKYAATTIINHHFRPARYYQCDQWIMVVEVMDGRDVLRTIHTGQAKRWQAKRD